MSELARRLAQDFEQYLSRSADGIKRGGSALADFLSRGANAGVADMEAALYGSRVKPGAVLTDAGYVDDEALKQGRYDSGLEPEGNFTRAMTLMGGAMSPARGAGIAAKAGVEGKAAVVAANAAHHNGGMDDHIAAEIKRLETIRRTYEAGQKNARINAGELSLSPAEEDQFFGFISRLGPNSDASFRMGMNNAPAPTEYTYGWRYGEAPDLAVSRNNLTDRAELGLSMAEAFHPQAPQWTGVSRMIIEGEHQARRTPRAWYSGYFHPANEGGDNEPLLLFARRHGSEDDARAYAEAVANALRLRGR